HRETEAFDAVFCQRKTDESPSVRRHEVDRGGRDLFRGHAEIAFVFPVLVIHQNDHPAAANLVASLFNRSHCHGKPTLPPDISASNWNGLGCNAGWFSAGAKIDFHDCLVTLLSR